MKTKKLIGLGFILIMIFTLTGCGKETISSDEFTEIFEDNGYQVISTFDNGGGSYYTATKDENKIIFYANSFGNEQAKEKFIWLEEVFEEYFDDDFDDDFDDISTKDLEAFFGDDWDNDYRVRTDGSISSTSVDLWNYQKYSIGDSTKFKIVIRVKNTLLYAEIPKSAKENVMGIIKELGY